MKSIRSKNLINRNESQYLKLNICGQLQFLCTYIKISMNTNAYISNVGIHMHIVHKTVLMLLGID